MRDRPAVVAVLAVLLAACTVEPGVMPGHEEPLALPEAPSPVPAFGFLAGRGVTTAGCPGTANPDNGCIHLGAILGTSGPADEFTSAALEGARAFWEHVNARGGVTHRRADGLEARFDVTFADHVAEVDDVPGTREAFAELEPDVLSLGLTAGTTTTSALLPELIRTDTAAVPLSWWSGWEFEPLVAETGASACLQAVNGLDWALDRLGGAGRIDHVVVVHHPDRSGEDVVAGVEAWVDPDHRDHGRVLFDRTEHAVTVEPGGDVGPAVELVDALRPEVVLVDTGPEELAAIAERTAERGWDGMLVGTAPSWTPSLLDDPEVAEVLTSHFWRIGVVPSITSTAEAMRAMRDALGLDESVAPGASALPANDAWVAGWVAQYPLLHAFRDAVLAGDLTPAGVHHALEQVSVDYEGALPTTNFHAAPDDRATRRVVVARPDPDAVLGLRVEREAFVGGTARDLHLTRPCTDA